ncbi:MAG: cytochrome c oxidase accessory protein CcoG [Alphaproteobacteria bacterium]|nr:cytochrome c oxidase accessory protein CcoG [Alphaproteobacteria bacterium]MBL6937736.1 cytochrome c oxidase accessory protein CcoG [Alphaproteobacteria bacterium]MBL7099074.1 cytochrome c oxidase accessory protein CcoG [Alphaproteobacteria bacterium]
MRNAMPAAAEVERSDAQASNSAANREFYKSRVPIHPKLVHGTYRRIKWIVMAVTLAIYYVVPWIRWDRGPHAPDQAVLVDLAHERFYFFFVEIWPQEVYYITGLLILAAVALFLVTSLFGRLWCGYACPQTVWTDLFIYVENLIEGDRNARIRLAAGPWTASKITKRVSKHATWLVIAVLTGGAWVFYFTDAPALAHDLIAGSAPLVAYGTIAVLTFTTYTLGGMMREQVCTYMCPWPRIQGAMMDKESLQVTYRIDRGEPRAHYRKGETWDGRGDCIDCRQCVAVCPMGIDIRDGAQLECINCGLCIDACDDVMPRIGRPLRLIAYDTDANVLRRQRHEKERFRFVRPRTIGYAAVLGIVCLIMLGGLVTRSSIGLDVIRDRNPNFVQLADGSVRNAYTLKLMNRADKPRDFYLTLDGVDDRRVNIIGLGFVTLPVKLSVEADKVRAVRVLVTVPRTGLHAGSQDIEFTLRDAKTGEDRKADAVFISGAN